MTILSILVLLSLLTGCAKFGMASVVRVKDGEVQFRECQMTVWTVIIAMGYSLHDCEDKFIQFERGERNDGRGNLTPPSI
jgi:uncharacterized membrane protein